MSSRGRGKDESRMPSRSINFGGRGEHNINRPMYNIGQRFQRPFNFRGREPHEINRPLYYQPTRYSPRRSVNFHRRIEHRHIGPPPVEFRESDEEQPMSETPYAPVATVTTRNGSPPTLSLAEKKKYIANFNFPNCNFSGKYEKLAKIGQGTFGEVFRAREKSTNRIVAMKKVLIHNAQQGFPFTALREIKILQKLKHENIVELIEVCHSQANPSNNFHATFYLVLEFCDHDLAGLLTHKKMKFSVGEIKSMMKQLLNGLFYIHVNNIIHRDMKPANVLITKDGILKLADFGLSRAINPPKENVTNRYSGGVVTLWYRAPEILLGDRNYGPPVDLWAAGCIMAEMWTRSAILQTNSEQQQLLFISRMCGSITPSVWPGVENLALYKSMSLPQNLKRRIRERLSPYVRNTEGCDLLDKLLTLDPKQRINADAALYHDFFWTDPMPREFGSKLSMLDENVYQYSSRK